MTFQLDANDENFQLFSVERKTIFVQKREREEESDENDENDERGGKRLGELGVTLHF